MYFMEGTFWLFGQYTSLVFGVGGIATFFLIYAVYLYNSIIGSKNSVEENKSTIDTVFQNRYDLIPNIVEVVKKYAEHESTVLEKVVALRSSAMNTKEVTADKLANENMLSGTLKSIFALGEAYPNLKANENFINLQNQWGEIEDRMQAARRGYNSAVKAFNDKKQMFPSNILASMMSLQTYPMFEAAAEAKESLNAKELFAK